MAALCSGVNNGMPYAFSAALLVICVVPRIERMHLLTVSRHLRAVFVWLLSKNSQVVSNETKPSFTALTYIRI